MVPPFPVRRTANDPANDAASRAFPPGSRYHGIPTARYVAPDGAVVPYLTRRFCPQGADLPLLSIARVKGHERLDQLTTEALGDPTQFWRVADANNALDPFHLVAVPGRALRVPVPRNIPNP